MARPGVATTNVTSMSYSQTTEHSASSSRSTSASSVFSSTGPAPAVDASTPARKPKRLVLCFDGTGNRFSGTTADTNIVKIFDKLNRNDDLQYHYYQTGIGTYDISGGSINKSFLGGIKSSVSKTIDQGLATTFDAHVISGYKFLMNYYEKGDLIYMFGFSRGAFTARFLSRMVGTVGLLSRGNDEMIPAAYSLYQDYEAGRKKQEKKGAPMKYVETFADDDTELDVSQRQNRDGLAAFTNTFCRREKFIDENGNEVYRGVQVFFLGLFDCVGSVAVLENPFAQPPEPVNVVGHAKHVRHAVAVDERRVKFRAALLDQDFSASPLRQKGTTAKEVWFPGNHGDVGGGWEAPAPPKKDCDLSWFGKFQRRISFLIWGRPYDAPHRDSNMDPYQMSDVPLAWMIRELQQLEEPECNKLTWNKRLKGFQSNFEKNIEQARKAPKHDTMVIGGGSSALKAMFWQLLEILPLMPRKELESGEWVRRKWLPNFGATRDIPVRALLHRSLIDRVNDSVLNYRPRNNHGGNTKACIEQKELNELVREVPYGKRELQDQEYHQLYSFTAGDVIV